MGEAVSSSVIGSIVLNVVKIQLFKSLPIKFMHINNFYLKNSCMQKLFLLEAQTCQRPTFHCVGIGIN